MINTKSFPIQKIGLALIVSLFLISCQDLSEDYSLEEEETLSLQSGDFVPGKYIVVLHEPGTKPRQKGRYQEMQDRMRTKANEIAGRNSIKKEKIKQVYGHVIAGFAADLEWDDYQALLKDPAVKYIEPDGKAYPNFQKKTPPGKEPKEEDPIVEEPIINDPATWGLDRIDQRSLPLNGKYNSVATGKGVTAYIMDSGIKTDHEEFQDRATLGFDGSGDFEQDCTGHGTHVAGTVGGLKYGVAKDVKLVSVKVLGTDGNPCENWAWYSVIMAGLDWIAATADGPSVINISIGGGRSSSMDAAVNKIVEFGIPLFASAGNNNDDALKSSPASAAGAFAVGASRDNDNRANFSNWGPKIGVFAPGQGITSAYILSNSSYTVNSGTSMASPHVAGVAALYLEGKPGATPQQVYDFISQTSTKNKIGFSASLHNHLLYSGLSYFDAGSADPNRINFIFDLIGSSQKMNGNSWAVTLQWTKVDGDYLDLYANEVFRGTIPNTNQARIDENGRSLAPIKYKLCLTGSQKCSNEITVVF